MNRNLMRQAQKQLAQIQRIQDELEGLTVEGSSGGGVVKVTMSGKQVVASVSITPEALEDVELLQDLVAA
ncbi:MAG: YbaB/EbfC family nucleoid-associated protein, partial [Chloroflexota bacterium]